MGRTHVRIDRRHELASRGLRQEIDLIHGRSALEGRAVDARSAKRCFLLCDRKVAKACGVQSQPTNDAHRAARERAIGNPHVFVKFFVGTRNDDAINEVKGIAAQAVLARPAESVLRPQRDNPEGCGDLRHDLFQDGCVGCRRYDKEIPARCRWREIAVVGKCGQARSEDGRINAGHHAGTDPEGDRERVCRVFLGEGSDALSHLDDAAPVSLSLTNTFTALLGGFGVEKSVAGDVSLDDPLFDSVGFAVDYEASDGQAGTLLLNRAGEWAASTGAVFPVGTVVTLTESDVADLPEWLSWDGYAWLAGAGYTVSEDRLTATVTIAESAQPALALENTFSELAGGFAVTKRVSGEGSELVPRDLAFAVEYSLDNGTTWIDLSALTLDAPLVAGPSDLPLGTSVLIREVAPASIPGIEWGAPAFSGTGVAPGTGGAPASFVITEADATVDVVLTNPTTPTPPQPTPRFNGQFQVTKKITGAGSTLVKGDPLFTVTYTWDGLVTPEKLTIKADEFASSVPIPAGTVVTILEIAPVGGLVEGASWGDPVFVTSEGTVLTNGSSITVSADTVLSLVLENPTKPPLPPTGSAIPWFAIVLGALVIGAGGVLIVRGIRRRDPHA